MTEALSRKAEYFFLSNRNGTLLLDDPTTNTLAGLNGVIPVMSTVMRQFLSFAMKAEAGAWFFGCQDAVPLRNFLIEIGHPQGATFTTTDNECAEGIVCDTVKQRRSKAMDMQFYWVKRRIS